MCPHNRRAWGDCFWCGSNLRRRRCSFLSELYLLNQWVEFGQTHTDTLLGRGKEMMWLDFGDIDLILRSYQHFEIFKSWPKKAWLHTISWTKWRILTNFIYCNVGWFKDLIRFWWHWPNFQNHHTIKTVKMSIVWIPSHKPNGGFWPHFHTNTIGT